jgi:hypothetical protein
MIVSYKNLATALGFASAILTMTTIPSSAQMAMYGDTWSHVSVPAANGQCWHPTDAAFSERGYGYWGACRSASGARAQAIRPPNTVYRSTRPARPYN